MVSRRSKHFQHAAANLLLVHLLQPQAEGHVLVHIQVREQGVFLEHGVHLALVGRQIGDVLPVKKNIAGARLDKSANDSEGRCLAAAGRAQEGNELLVVNVQRETVEHVLPVEANNNVLQ